MPSILFILLIAFVVFGPRKLPGIAAKVLRPREPWEQLMKQMTESLSDRSRGAGSISTSSVGQPKPTATPAELLSSLAKSAGGD